MLNLHELLEFKLNLFVDAWTDLCLQEDGKKIEKFVRQKAAVMVVSDHFPIFLDSCAPWGPSTIIFNYVAEVTRLQVGRGINT